MRSFFISEFTEFQKDVTGLNLYGQIYELYSNHAKTIDKDEIHPILKNVNQVELSTYLFQREISTRSTIFVIFIVGFIFLLFVAILLRLTKPLVRLEQATQQVITGNLKIRVHKSRFSPINDFIQSFNTMVAELESNQNKLLQAEKDMMWREIAQVMAHEIKNPLTPIRLTIERLEHKYLYHPEDFNPLFEQSLEILYEEIDNLQRLVKEFSRFARMPSSYFTNYNLNDQIREIIVPYNLDANIRLDLDNRLPLFYGDRAQMKQVLVNLIQNALDASRDPKQLDITTQLQDNHFNIRVKDYGSGISGDDLPYIFRPYFTKKEKGTGLGLAIVKRIVIQHGGNITVDSTEGQGTLFLIKIKYSPEKSQQEDLPERDQIVE